MAKLAFVFPGQGSQAVGMGKDVFDKYRVAQACFDEADLVLEQKLSNLIFEGPQQELLLTSNTQPALLTTSLALLEVFNQKCNIKPDFVAGHSLGEYTAYAAAGSITTRDAVKLVRSRGMFMEEAVPAGIGGMFAILGMEQATLQAITEEVSTDKEPVQLANINCPGQIVISGSKAGVEKASRIAKEKGAKRAIPLEVSGPFHSSLMKPAAQKLEEILIQLSISPSTVPVISNYAAKPTDEPEMIKRSLVQQLYSPVLWQQSVEWLIDAGVDTFVEFGPGKVLSGLIRKINRQVTTLAIFDEASCLNVISQIEGEQNGKANG